MTPEEFGTRDAGAPQTLRWGFVELGDLPRVTARVRCYTEGDDVAGISVFDDFTDDAGPNTALVYLKMYRLPAAGGTFAEDLKFFSSSAKAWPLPGGGPFEAGLLAPAGVPAGWRHKSVQTIATGPGIVHAWRGHAHALLLRYVLVRGDLLSRPLLRWAADNLRVHETAWAFDLAAPQPAPSDDGDYLEEISNTHHRPLDESELDQVAGNARRAADALQLPPGMPPQRVVAEIRQEVDALRPQFATLKPNVRHNLAVFF
jgi:hypothetical protein